MRKVEKTSIDLILGQAVVEHPLLLVLHVDVPMQNVLLHHFFQANHRMFNQGQSIKAQINHSIGIDEAVSAEQGVTKLFSVKHLPCNALLLLEPLLKHFNSFWY